MLYTPARVGVLDPPWWFGNRRLTRKDNPAKKCRHGPGAHGNYKARTNELASPMMKIPEVCELGEHLRPIWADDAYLFLWMPASIDIGSNRAKVFDAWGFREVNYGFVWVKTNKLADVDEEDELAGDDNDDVYGMGYYIPNNIEIAFFGVRKEASHWHPIEKGSGTRPRQVIRRPRVYYPDDTPPVEMEDGTLRKLAGKEIHSRKPEEMQDRIEQWLVPHLNGFSMFEGFATRQRPGWNCLGHEISGRDIRDELKDLALGIAFERTLAVV